MGFLTQSRLSTSTEVPKPLNDMKDSPEALMLQSPKPQNPKLVNVANSEIAPVSRFQLRRRNPS